MSSDFTKPLLVVLQGEFVKVQTFASCLYVVMAKMLVVEAYQQRNRDSIFTHSLCMNSFGAGK